ncbi:MAG: arginine repressor [Acidobacteria bacterium]|nr:MAG: arginine repressor [Acidobacteriota bacterium]
MKSWRQSQILDLIDKDAVTSQEALREQLEARGIRVTQATLSRDLKQMGLVKRAGDGAYVRPGAERGGAAMGEQMRKAVTSLVRSYERVDTFIVIRTDPGQANGLAVLMDRVKVPEVAGTLAGDDTILLVCRGLDNAIQMEQKLGAMVKGS